MKSKIDAPKEDYEQIKLCAWLDKEGLRYYAIPNGGKRSFLEAVKLKRCGLKSGVPDVCIPLPSGPYSGLYIELKRVSGGKVSENQEDWIAYLNSVGYLARVAKGFEEAKKIVIDYLALTPKAA